MTSPRETDRLIKAFLAEGQAELPDRAYDAVRSQIDHTRQRVVIGPWREEQMSRFATFAIAAAAVVLIAVIGIRFLPTDGGIGGQPTSSAPPTPTPTVAPTPTAIPTATLTPSPTPVADPNGPLTPGAYVAHPFAPNNSTSFTFTVPSEAWEGVADSGRMIGVTWRGVAAAGDSEGLSMGFLLVSSLNGDPCNWSGAADDVAIGPTVDDLVAALTSSTDFVTSEASDVSLGGYSGKQLVVTMPSLSGGHADYASDCDEKSYRIWNAEGFDMDAQGPEDRWTLRILDVEGERVVIRMTDFEDSRSDPRAELQSIVDSIVITAP